MKNKYLTIGLLLDDTLDSADGVQQAVTSIGEKLRSKGHDVHYIVSTTTRNDLKNIHSIGRHLSLPFNGNSVRTPLPVSSREIKKLFSKVNFDILHVQMPYSPFFTAKVLKLAPKKVKKIGTFHILPYNFAANYGTKILGRVMKKSIQSLDHHFAVSQPALEFMNASFSVNGTVLPNPVDYPFYSSFNKQPTKKKQMVFVGRFEERKGVRQLLNAYALVNEKIRIKCEFKMIGKGPLFNEIKKKSKEEELDITFPGFVTEKEKAQSLANADVAVFPSISGESFGIVLTEAMAAGAGITIGGNNPGYSSVLGAWPESLFDPKDEKSFAALLTKMLQENEFVSSIGTSQHEIVKQYDLNVITDKLCAVYTGSQ